MRGALESLIGTVVCGAVIACGAFTSEGAADDKASVVDPLDGSIASSTGRSADSSTDASAVTSDGAPQVAACAVPSDFCDDFEGPELNSWTPRGASEDQPGEAPGTRALRFRIDEGGSERSAFIEQTRSWPESNRLEVELRVRIHSGGTQYIKGPSNVVVTGEGFGVSLYKQTFSCDGAGVDDPNVTQVFVNSWQTLRYEVVRSGNAVRLRCQVDDSAPAAMTAPLANESTTYTLRVGVAYSEGPTSFDVDWIRVRHLPVAPASAL